MRRRPDCSRIEIHIGYNFKYEMRAGLLIMLTLLVSLPAQAQQSASEAPEKQILIDNSALTPIPFQCSNTDLKSFAKPCTSDAPCSVYLHLSAVEPVDTKLIVTGYLYCETTKLYSILLLSEDGGQSWSEPHDRIPGAELELAHFHDLETGWIAGHIAGPPPRDPFFLLTTDGGKYWRHRAVNRDASTGVINRFWFDDENDGGLLIDRVQTDDAAQQYERYETMTGGESWDIREVSSKLIPLRNVIPVSQHPDWRLIEDKDTLTWLVEHHQPNNWVTVATFPIEIGLCIQQEKPSPKTEPANTQPGELPTAPGGVFEIPDPFSTPPIPTQAPFRP